MMLSTSAGAPAGVVGVVIDPGHGGSASAGSDKDKTLSSPNNARTPSGTLEKDLTLELALKIKQAVESANRPGEEPRIDVFLTRTADINLDFSKRAAVASSCPVPLLAVISIHFNAFNGKSSGTLAMVGHADTNANHAADHDFAATLTEAVSRAVRQYLPESRPRSVIDDRHLHGGAGSYFFHQLRLDPHLARVPKCILEVEFIDSPATEEKLLAKRPEAFEDIARAIADFLRREALSRSAAPQAGG